MPERAEAEWYVVHTYSGHENKVKTNIEKMVENRGMQDVIHEVKVPVELVVEEKDGKKKTKEKKMFPGYVIIKMVMTDQSWYLVRNTRGVTGFVGPASKPIPLTKQEMKNMGITDEVISTADTDVDWEVGDAITVVSGPFEGFEGKVESVNVEKKKIKAFVSMFGRDTLVELDFEQAHKEQ